MFKTLRNDIRSVLERDPAARNVLEVLGKRHPTLQDRVVVGAGAKILGAIPAGNREPRLGW